ncbi:MAG: ABC transporter ATP-binding protein [Desulfarculaceae bacterium]|nr:ABC transporter ATP-binding protein [Desulfarculaceae bacterium]MCF8072685.1 ABC transporter ATP-binding protein [Desulfarculaceae bacterium]MCF8102564.1 ABC transporter ATP-binding protein [Desulfarculaceae bacterium]MCF8116473.1 ABC transporter ATP-binding protein [Desulfarculaceae bacterium]
MSLELQGLVKNFPAQGGGAEVPVLDGLAATVERGRLVSLIGPSGCGKTTLLRIIAGLEQADQGRVLLEGGAITGPSAKVGMVFQQYALLPWRTCLGNVELGLEMAGQGAAMRRERARGYLDAFGLGEFAGRYPHQLSGGMQQRVAIARTLILGPQVVLMDEPFGSLDSQTRNALQEFLLQVWSGQGDTIVFVTHNVDEAVFLSDEVLVLSARPARVLERFSITEPRPRDRTSEASNAIRREILGVLSSQREM